MNDKTYLFACGTLRKDFAPKPDVELKDLVFLGEGKVKGKLFDLGNYPGAIEGEGDIRGDLFEVKNETTALAVLDDYEGDEFSREAVTVRTADGDQKQAWMYRYLGDTSGKQEIADGDYLNYLKTKDSLR